MPAPQSYEMTWSDFGFVETALWLVYSVLSAVVVFKLRDRSRTLQLSVALTFSAVDFCVPLTFDPTRHASAIALAVFLFPVTRPAKLVLSALGKGPLASAAHFKAFLVQCMLPVIPIRCLPDNVQRRMAIYQPSRAGAQHLAVACMAIVGGAYLTKNVEPASEPTLRSSTLHIVSFAGYLLLLLDTAALLATVLGAGAVVQPFNNFLLATSIADWWRYRWDTVVSLTLRMTVYDPLTAALGKPSNKAAATAARLAPAMSTFLVSALLHEYTLYCLDRRCVWGQVSKFFLVQPALVMAERVLHGILRPFAEGVGIKESSASRLIGHMTTVGLVTASLYVWWCPAYDVPYSRANERVGDAVLRLAGLCKYVQFCGVSAA